MCSGMWKPRNQSTSFVQFVFILRILLKSVALVGLSYTIMSTTKTGYVSVLKMHFSLLKIDK